MNVLTRNASWPLLVCLAVLSAGCGQAGRGEVVGTVTLEGTPVVEGTITFFPTSEKGGPATGAAIVQGAYRVDRGVSLGKNRVEIQAMGKTGKKAPDPNNPKVMLDEVLNILPEKYNAKSELEIEVRPGRNSFDFTLKKD